MKGALVPMSDGAMSSRNDNVRFARPTGCGRARLVLQSMAAMLMLVLFLGLQFLSASPALHQSLHADAGHADHQCAVTAISQGQVDHAPVALTVMPLVPTETISLSPLEVSFASAPSSLLSGRGPPVLA